MGSCPLQQAGPCPGALEMGCSPWGTRARAQRASCSQENRQGCWERKMTTRVLQMGRACCRISTSHPLPPLPHLSLPPSSAQDKAPSLVLPICFFLCFPVFKIIPQIVALPCLTMQHIWHFLKAHVVRPVRARQVQKVVHIMKVSMPPC